MASVRQIVRSALAECFVRSVTLLLDVSVASTLRCYPVEPCVRTRLDGTSSETVSGAMARLSLAMPPRQAHSNPPRVSSIFFGDGSFLRRAVSTAYRDSCSVICRGPCHRSSRLATSRWKRTSSFVSMSCCFLSAALELASSGVQNG